MTVRLTHKAGDTFSIDCQAFIDLAQTTPRDLTNVSVEASMDAPMAEEYVFTVTIDPDPTSGRFIIGASQYETADWADTTYFASISYTENDTKSSTETFQLLVVDDFNMAEA